MHSTIGSTAHSDLWTVWRTVYAQLWRQHPGFEPSTWVTGYNQTEWAIRATIQQTRDIEPLLWQCWSTVYDAGPTLTQQWFNVSCLLGTPPTMLSSSLIVPLDMKGCICHLEKWQIHPFISHWTTYATLQRQTAVVAYCSSEGATIQHLAGVFFK